MKLGELYTKLQELEEMIERRDRAQYMSVRQYWQDCIEDLKGEELCPKSIDTCES